MTAPEVDEDSAMGRGDELRRRQHQFRDELARTKAKLATMPRGWEARGAYSECVTNANPNPNHAPATTTKA